MVRVWLVLMVLWGLAACAASPDDSSPGTCELSCSNPRIPARGFKLTPLMPEGTEISFGCRLDDGVARGVLTAPFKVQYYVERVIGTPVGGGDPPEEGNFPAGEFSNNSVGLSGIAFEPWIFGAVANEKTHEDFLKDNVPTPGRFAGVVTPQSEWCSDACGIMTFEVWGVCLNDSDSSIVAGITSGNLVADRWFNISVTEE